MNWRFAQGNPRIVPDPRFAHNLYGSSNERIWRDGSRRRSLFIGLYTFSFLVVAIHYFTAQETWNNISIATWKVVYDLNKLIYACTRFSRPNWNDFFMKGDLLTHLYNTYVQNFTPTWHKFVFGIQKLRSRNDLIAQKIKRTLFVCTRIHVQIHLVFQYRANAFHRCFASLTLSYVIKYKLRTI